MKSKTSTGRTNRAQFSRVRSVSQIELEFRGDDPVKLFEAVRKEVLQWLANRAGRHLPKRAWEGESFDMLEVGAQPVSALALDDPKYWCFRISDADKEVPRRSWCTEAGILVSDSLVLLGCRLQCVALGESPEFPATIPGLVEQAASRYAAYADDMSVSRTAWQVSSEKNVASLVELIIDPKRIRPVVVVSLGDEAGRDCPPIIDVDGLARATIGAV